MADTQVSGGAPSPDVETGERKCYICLECEGDDLIAPCRCSGSMKWVHRKCLNKWRVDAVNPQNFTHCRQCKFQFRLVLQRPDDSIFQEADERMKKRRRRFLFRSVSNFILINLVIQATLCALAIGIRAVDNKEELVKLFNFPQVENTPAAGHGNLVNAIRHHKCTYYCAALLLALFSVGVTGALVGCMRLCSSAASPTDCCHCPRYHDPFDAYLHYYGCRACCECGSDCCYFCSRLECPACECNRCDPDCCGCDLGRVNSSDCGGKDCASVIVMIIVFVVIAFVFVGLVMVFVAIVVWIQKLYTRYMQMYELRQLTGEYVVEDLSNTDMHSTTLVSPKASTPTQQEMRPSAPPRELVCPNLPCTDLETAQALDRDMQAVYGLVR